METSRRDVPNPAVFVVVRVPVKLELVVSEIHPKGCDILRVTQ